MLPIGGESFSGNYFANHRAPPQGSLVLPSCLQEWVLRLYPPIYIYNIDILISNRSILGSTSPLLTKVLRIFFFHFLIFLVALH